jgi:hypothetical protein
LTPQEVSDQLTQTALDLGPIGRDSENGWGLVDAAAALGVVTAPAEPSNAFAARLDSTIWGERHQAVVGWTMPARNVVDDWTVTRSQLSGSLPTVLPGDAVRLETEVAHGDWFTVTAHIGANDVVNYPMVALDWRDLLDATIPRPVKHVHSTRLDDRVRVEWTAPLNTSRTDVVEVVVRLDDGSWISKVLDATTTYPTRATIKLPKSARWKDARVQVRSAAAIDDPFFGLEYLGEWVRDAKTHAAPFGLHVDSMLGAGRSAAEVTGGISRANARKLCGNGTCQGDLVTVVAVSGGNTDRVNARLNARGVFHATVDIVRGDRRVDVRVVGGQDLTSGPFQTLRVVR